MTIEERRKNLPEAVVRDIKTQIFTAFQSFDEDRSNSLEPAEF